MSSASMRGHFPSCPSYDANDDSLNRFRRPSAFSASIVWCRYAPEADTSSDFWSGVPHNTRFLLNRESGAMYASIPMMGLIPAAVMRR